MKTKIAAIEEVMNSITHGAGAVLSLIGLSIMVVLASLYGTANHIVSCSIFGATLVLLYISSTLYHSFRTPRVKHIFKILDHSCIYLLIAGTYTPFLLVTLRGFWGWTLFAVVWLLAICGIFFKIFFVYRFKIIATLAYLLLGLMAVVALKPLCNQLPAGGIAWLVVGGLAYTVGVPFYLWNRLPYHHAIWHLFVLCGSACHYFAIMLYVVPVKA